MTALELTAQWHEPGITAWELAEILGNITLQLADIMSFGLGALCAIAFVIAANTKW